MLPHGEEVASAVFNYPRWKKGMYCNAPKNQFRQHPQDYLDGLEYTITEALKQAPADVAENVVGISVDTTGSTPVAVDEKGVPLSLTPGFQDKPECHVCIVERPHGGEGSRRD
jgi:L-ribulokinase